MQVIPVVNSIIRSARSIIPACDVPTQEQLRKLVEATCYNEKIGAYKIGFRLGLKYGLPEIVETVREYTKKPVIYDHQKGATDIPKMGKVFAEVCSEAGVNAVILFPQAGPETEIGWIRKCHDSGLGVIVGGEMTHGMYKASEGGWIRDDALLEMYLTALRQGVADFVVPGNRPERIGFYRENIGSAIHDLEESMGYPTNGATYYAPGFVAQGGKITEAAVAAGSQWHAIVGRGIYNPNKVDDLEEVPVEDMKRAAEEMTSQI